MIILKMGGKFQRRVLILEGSFFFLYCIKYYWKNANTYLLLLDLIEGGLIGSSLNKILELLHLVMKKLSVNHGALYTVKGDNSLHCKLRSTFLLAVLNSDDESFKKFLDSRDGGETPQIAPPGAAASPLAENSSVDNKAADFVNESPPQQVEAFDEFDPRGSVSGTEFSMFAIL